MAIPVEMPKLSDTMEEGVLSAWLADEGDEVSAGDVIAEVETDKATMDLEVFDDGVLLKRVADEGATVPLGSLIAVLGEADEDISDILAEYGVGGNGTADAEGEDEADAAAGQADGEESADDEAEGTAAEAMEETEAPDEEGETSQAPSAAGSADGRIKASPLARRLASEHGIELGSIDGSGPQGRIVKRDVEARIEEGEAPAEEAAAEAPEAAPAFRAPGDEAPAYRSENISQMRKAISRRLADSKFTAPHFYLTIDVDTAKAEAVRADLNVLAEEQEQPRLSINDLITKACARALRQHPQVNASYLADEGEIRYHNQAHVAVAVAIDEGLITPVIRHADQKGLAQIAKETRELAGKARDKKLQPEEYEGSTFTTSNLGMFGIDEFTAIINPPNACILAIGTIRDEAVVQDGEVVPGRRMRLTLSCDHRVVDGATGAEFLATVKQYLEEPMSMLL